MVSSLFFIVNISNLKFVRLLYLEYFLTTKTYSFIFTPKFKNYVWRLNGQHAGEAS